jgi:hypothetical protein
MPLGYRKTGKEMHTYRLAKTGPEVSAIGLGCMGMSGMYGPSDREEGLATIHAALDAGVNLLDTGDFYGMGDNEMLIGEALKAANARMLSSASRPERSAIRRARGSATIAGRRRSRTSSPTRCSVSVSTTSTSTALPASTRTCRSKRPSARSPT